MSGLTQQDGRGPGQSNPTETASPWFYDGYCLTHAVRGCEWCGDATELDDQEGGT